MHVLRARAVDDFILFDQLLLHALGGLDERAAFTRDVLVKVSVSVSAWPLLIRGIGEGWASAFLNRAGDRSFFGHLRPSSAFCPPHLLRLGHASPFVRSAARCVSGPNGAPAGRRNDHLLRL